MTMEAAAEVVEVIVSTFHADRLYWMSHSSPPSNLPGSYYFCIDADLVYEPFSTDFGPLNLGMVFHFSRELEKLMKAPSFNTYRIYHYTSLDPVKRVNSAFLICAYQVLVLGKSGFEAWEKFESLAPFLDYRDASLGPCTYKCTVLHCLRGIEIAIKLGWLNYATFNLEDYEKNERLENGDMNWVIPGKLLAFSCPAAAPEDEGGWRCFTPEDYVPLFKRIGVEAVVRLNKKTYDAAVLPTQRFTRAGIRHYDLYFLDGSVPSEDIVQRFLTIAENEPKALAVHCKAGLGRTGTLIGVYAMKHFGFPPAEFIGWVRVCRPGSVLGPQQQFLISIEPTVLRWASEYRLAKAVAKTPPPKRLTDRSESFGASDMHKFLSPEEKSKADFGDLGQAERLISAKKTVQSPLRSTPTKSEARLPSVPRAQPLSPLSPPKRIVSQTKIVHVSKNTTVFTTTTTPTPITRKTKTRSIFRA